MLKLLSLLVQKSGHFPVVLGLILMLTSAASAYTLVMRGGRRIEVPRSFVVTQNTVTYEVAEGIQVTVQMGAIDIQATELANNEPAGSFLKRAVAAASTPAPPVQQPSNGVVTAHQERSLTNRDLASYARAREESERAYDRRRRDLGLPSLEESRKRVAAESESIQEELGQKRSKQEDLERYWSSRASVLRMEIAATDAEINFLRSRLGELSSAPLSASFTVVTDSFPLALGRQFGFGRQVNAILPSVPVGAQMIGAHQVPQSTFPRPIWSSPIVSATPSRMPVQGGGGFRAGIVGGHILHNQRPRPLFGGVGSGLQFGFPNLVPFSYPFQSYDSFYERSALITRLNEVSAMRARLGAQWRVLEDEARRAGAPPGWLRE